MSSYNLRFVDTELTPNYIQKLQLQGFELGHSILGKPWLTMINLSNCSCDEAVVKMAQYPGKNQVALLNPEQTDLASCAMQHGAQDYLLLPLDLEQLTSLLNRFRRLEQPDTDFIVSSTVSRQLLMLAHRAATTEASILLTGESGTGKEPLAHYIHRHSNRSEQPFIAVNCAAIPESILESILFGHVKGAFTGASCDQAGKFEQANGGTLLLDEIGEMPFLLQSKLLRVLQEREVERLGGHKTIPLNIRVIASTNRDLRQAVKNGDFREDLFYRLDVLPLKITPLRERKEDILPLAEHFLQKYKPLCDHQACYFSEPAQQRLLSHDWPGNVRELENTIQRALVMRRGQALQAAELGIEAKDNHCTVTADNPKQGLKASKRQAEFQYILDTLKRFRGHRSQSAESLGMTTRALRYKLVQMREEGIDIEQALGLAA
ncbi:sigma-54 dependent transcriptional regulator [Shewanella sp. D64]|uniref:sigma-54 interaction domain-containing protein n=1 Tax=unclassified Shewanella TaxID=196818 RepID=UPI0022BA16AE|nr:MULTISPECIES: sigma-54 dependent transcriptional regulator [unclassified Shewanella]MEC4725909.1 sigma-54 dependent transcriptional regulator [Shewanella sp. D64]MEC4737164.1 sigma-54 dependent transcriptional regulator [Shewanella sp. E94]WBJ95644.1 sigma-54 dependent transcriptional regulator [Shewanella sp. MTB7]